jgi:hypothetical protein
MAIRHTVVATGTDDPTKQVSKNAWNADHTDPEISDVVGLPAALDAKQDQSPALDATTAAFTTEQETKLAGIEAGATENSADSVLLDRANHTGAQAISTITNLQASLDSKSNEDFAIAMAVAL